MREILFRGKRKDNQEWVEGFFAINTICSITETYLSPVIIKNPEGIYDTESYEIIPETVGQYTGLTDKNGMKIFEGDILRGERYVDYGQTGEFKPHITVVKWNVKKSAYEPLNYFDGYSYDIKNYEIIGNIHDNPELLEVKENA